MGKRILVNKYNLPQTLVDAVKYDTHKQIGTISVTTLIDGAQIRYLKSLHDYESDVSDNIYALMGTALHHVLERANIQSIRQRSFILTAETLIEKSREYIKHYPADAKRMEGAANWLFSLIPVFFPETQTRYIFEKTLTLPLGSDHVLSGTFDLYDKETGILYDYKMCSTFNYIDASARKKWEEQTNIYAYMLGKAGHIVTGIRIVAFFRDWNKHGVMSQKDYPPRQIMEITIFLQSHENVEKLINYHINQHRLAEAGNVPECSGEVRWATSDVWAVIKDSKGKKRALPGGLMSSEAAAKAFISENKHKYMEELYIQHRQGESRRCANGYCPVSVHCPQYKKEIQKRQILTGEI